MGHKAFCWFSCSRLSGQPISDFFKGNIPKLPLGTPIACQKPSLGSCFCNVLQKYIVVFLFCRSHVLHCTDRWPIDGSTLHFFGQSRDSCTDAKNSLLFGLALWCCQWSSGFSKEFDGCLVSAQLTIVALFWRHFKLRDPLAVYRQSVYYIKVVNITYTGFRELAI